MKSLHLLQSPPPRTYKSDTEIYYDILGMDVVKIQWITLIQQVNFKFGQTFWSFGVPKSGRRHMSFPTATSDCRPSSVKCGHTVGTVCDGKNILGASLGFQSHDYHDYDQK